MRSTDDLIRTAFAQGAGEITIRVTRLGPDNAPSAFQCVIHPHLRQTRAVQVAIRSNALAALRGALQCEPVELPEDDEPAGDIFG